MRKNQDNIPIALDRLETPPFTDDTASSDDERSRSPRRRKHNTPKKNRYFALVDLRNIIGLSLANCGRIEEVLDRTSRA